MTIRPLVPSAATATAAATGPLRFAFGPRFFLLLGAGLILLIPASIDPRAVFTLVIWNLVVAAAWAIDLRRIPSASIAATRGWTTPLTLGEASHVGLELTNRSGLSLRVDVIDDVPAALRRDLPEASAEVAAGGTARLGYDVAPTERGDAHLGSLSLRVRSSWSIAERWLTAPLGQTVRVFPDLVEAQRQSMFLLRSRQVTLEKRRARVIGIGRDFESLRDYQPGDEPRDICWTASARRARPVTRVYQPERSQAVWVLVDGGRLLRARAGNRTKLDLMVNAALGLCQVALSAGDRAGLLTYGRRIHARLAPGRGAHHLRAIIDALATVPSERAEGDHAAAAATVLSAQRQRALIVWLTDVAETAGVPDVVENAAALSKQHVVLFGVMKPMELVAIGDAVPSTESEMYRMLAAQETLARREVLLEGLRQRGALVIEMDAAGPTALLIDQYLGVKERNLI